MKTKPLLIGYVLTDALEKMHEEDIRALTGINIAFGTLQEGKVVWAGDQARRALTRIREVNPEIKIILSVGGWGAGGFSEAAATEQGRGAFAVSAANIVNDYALDGLDIDWEYPMMSTSGIASDLDDKYTFTSLLQSCRDELDKLPAPRRLLTIAAGAGKYWCANTEMEKVSSLLDYVQIMTYDLSNGFGNITGHHTNLYQPERAQSHSSAELSVRDFIAHGVPAEKLVIGAAFYSHWFQGVSDPGNGYYANSKVAGTHGPGYDRLVNEYIDKNGYVRYWDEKAKAPWLYNGDTFITYDDPESLAYKIRYIKDNSLLGIMYWEYSSAMEHSLTKVMREEINGS